MTQKNGEVNLTRGEIIACKLLGHLKLYKGQPSRADFPDCIRNRILVRLAEMFAGGGDLDDFVYKLLMFGDNIDKEWAEDVDTFTQCLGDMLRSM